MANTSLLSFPAEHCVEQCEGGTQFWKAAKKFRPLGPLPSPLTRLAGDDNFCKLDSGECLMPAKVNHVASPSDQYGAERQIYEALSA